MIRLPCDRSELLFPRQVGDAAVALRGAVVLADLGHLEPVLEALPHLGPHAVTEHQPQLVPGLVLAHGGGVEIPGHLPDILRSLRILV